ncbi:MAG: GNAT family protein [bacterium]|nr:GNAT family protein [bacterium]
MSTLSSLFFQKVELYLYDFMYPGDIPPCEARIETEHLILDKDTPDRDLIAAVQGERLTNMRFDRGEKCFIALHKGCTVSYIWGARRAVGVEEIGLSVQPAASEIYLYDAYTLGPWRGKSLYPAVLRRALEYGRDLGLVRSTIFVEAGNTASRRGVAKAGFSHFQTLFHRRWFGFPFRDLPPPASGHPPAVFIRPR